MNEESSAGTSRSLEFWPVAGTLSAGALPIIIAEMYVHNPGIGDELIALVGGALAMVAWTHNRKSGENDGE